jgi:hypothetical protein
VIGKPQQIRNIVAALQRRGDEVLLVRQQGPDEDASLLENLTPIAFGLIMILQLHQQWRQ